MTSRIRAFTVEGDVLQLFVSDCPACGVVFGIPKTLEVRRRSDREAFYCPNGHNLVFSGKSDEEKLREAEARALAATDQAEAATRDAEAARSALLRDRQRFANGVCPCCNRSFDNVLRHMKTKHPDYADTKAVATPVRFECSCGSRFTTYRGLRTHQGRVRPDDWARPGQSRWRAHLTTTGASR